MRNWIEAIHECGLTFIGKHTIGESLELYEAAHHWQGMMLGQYLMIPASAELLADITDSADSFRRFEDEIVSPFYFRLQGDWSWNLYIIFVVQDMAGLTAKKLNFIQRGKRFGKKTVISFEQLSDKLPLAKIPERLGGEAAGNPLLDWQHRLAPEGLLFCLDNFRTQPVRAYLDAGAEAQDRSLPVEPAAAPMPAAKPVGPIASLNFGSEFRPHVLNGTPPLHFTQVNLLAGPNGMGKTSVLEGIELAFTGSIQRNLLVDRQLTEAWNGSVVFADGAGEPFVGIPHPEEKKQRETFYYKYKVSPHSHSQLNSAFHQYNYFSSEAVHQFCFNASHKIDYRAAFARVIFGEQLERYEQCWRQHLDEFHKQGRGLREEHKELTANMRQKYKDGVQDSELLKERAHAQLQQMSKWMRHCLLAYPVPEEASGLAEIEQWLQHLKPRLHELDIASAPFSASLPQEINSLEQLSEQEQAAIAAHKDLGIQISELRLQLSRLPDPVGLEQKVGQLHAQFQNMRDEQKRWEAFSRRLKEMTDLIDQPDSRQARLRIREQTESLESSIRLLTDVDNLYGHLVEHPLVNTDISELRIRLDDLEAKRALEQAALAKSSELADKLKERTGKLQKLASELKATAGQVIHLHPGQSECPLCGHDYETAQYLKEAIDSRLQTDDDELTEALAAIELHKLKLQSMESDQRELRQELTRLEQLTVARSYLIRRNDIEEAKAFDSGSGLQAVQHALMRIRERMADGTGLLEELRRQAHALDERGIMLTSILELETLLDSPLLDPYIRNKQREALTSAILFEALKLGQERIAAELEAAHREYTAFLEQADQAKQTRQSLSEQLDGLMDKEKQYALRKRQIDELRQACLRLSGLNVQLPENQLWSAWMMYFRKLREAADELGQTLEPLILVEQKTRELNKLAGKLNETAAKLERCERAIKVLTELKGLADYGDDFVRSNFEAISKLFVALHSPNEFEGLVWSADNKIMAKRKGGGETCAIHQMSTGQRTSVYLAIFFIMHLVMESAPQFLLLDEPVAHMDELNVLGLLDFLRQLAITRGTQIFFTTANPHIATLFRRKFSFLEEHFRVFHLRRDIEGPVHVHIQQFRPDQESPLTAAN